MAVEIRHSGETVEVSSHQVTVEVESPSYSVETASGMLDGGTPYTGSYEARALFTDQVFPTAMKTMREDFTVRAINYTEAPNEYGTTVTIGG